MYCFLAKSATIIVQCAVSSRDLAVIPARAEMADGELPYTHSDLDHLYLVEVAPDRKTVSLVHLVLIELADCENVTFAVNPTNPLNQSVASSWNTKSGSTAVASSLPANFTTMRPITRQ